MKSKKHLQPLTSFKIESGGIIGGIKRGDKYWHTRVPNPEGGDDIRDHECPNGNILFETSGWS